MKTYTFKKEERLCSQRLINDLFHNGSSFVVYPYRVVFMVTADHPDSQNQVMISVSKRRVRKATKRNYIKRRIKESYRLQKEELLYTFLDEHGLKLTFSIQYLGDLAISYQTLYQKMGDMLKKLQHECVKKNMDDRHYSTT